LIDTQIIAHIDQLSKGERSRFDALMRRKYEEPGYRRFLELARASLNPETVRYIDDLLAQPS